MSIDVKIKDGWGGGVEACVSSRGQLVVAPLSFSNFYSVTAGVINTGYNIVPPKTGKIFVITDIILSANRNVGASDATVVIYTADSLTSTTVIDTIFTQEMIKQSNIAVTGLNVIATEGTWINIKTDDDDVFVNMAGYYVSA